MPADQLKTSVLFMVFCRPDTTAQVFEAIREARPTRLYVAADGPRDGREGEAEQVGKVREIATAVDWPCEVKTLFREKNLGCKAAIQTAISWFFEHEEQGIILEDDCLPHPDFFRYCEFCLNEFASEPSVWHINGNNFAADKSLYGQDNLAFVGLPQVWGWATWADRWNAAGQNTFYLNEAANERWSNWKISRLAKVLKLSHLEALKSGLDTWDYQWQISVLNSFGLAVSPSANLISNLGDGADATHTRLDQGRVRLPVEPLAGYNYTALSLNQDLTSWYEKKMGLAGWISFLKIKARSITGSAKATVERIFRSIFFSGIQPVVIASSGRAGSTLLFDAVASSATADRFAFLPKAPRGFLQRIASHTLVRISDIERHNAPFLKTHDLFRPEFADSAKYIFVFGEPLEAAKSVGQMGEKHGSAWIEEHIYHLVGQGTPYEILEKDVLNYEAQLKSWGEAEDVFVVHYDDLWDKREDLSQFLGFDLALPARRDRTKKQVPGSTNKALFDRLEHIEQELRAETS